MCTCLSRIGDNPWQTNERPLYSIQIETKPHAVTSAAPVLMNVKSWEREIEANDKYRKHQGKFVIKLHFGFCHLHWFMQRNREGGHFFHVELEKLVLEIYIILAQYIAVCASCYVAAAWTPVALSYWLWQGIIHITGATRAYTHHLSTILKFKFFAFQVFRFTKFVRIQELDDIL